MVTALILLNIERNKINNVAEHTPLLTGVE